MAISAVSRSRISPDKNDIRILANNGPQPAGKGKADLSVHLPSAKYRPSGIQWGLQPL